MARYYQFRVCYRPGRGRRIKKVNSENYLFVAEPDILKYLISKSSRAIRQLPLSAVHGDAFRENCGTVFWRQERNRQTPARGKQYDLEVTGVYETCRCQAHWHPEFAPCHSAPLTIPPYMAARDWNQLGQQCICTYVLLHEGADPGKLEAQMPAFLDKHFGLTPKQLGCSRRLRCFQRTRLNVTKSYHISPPFPLDDELEVNGIS